MAPPTQPRPARLAGVLLASALLASACREADEEPSSSQPAAAAPAPTPSLSESPRHLAAEHLGDPIPGLTQAELDAFERGRVIFERRFTPSDGLGPLYNAVSCASCHSTPTVGGSARLYRNFYLAMVGTPPFQFAFPELPSPVVPAFGPHGVGGATSFDLEAGRFVIPGDYFGQPVTVAQRNAIPIFGTGLFEFVSNATILANADPFDADGDGISGRANFDFGDLGRFGVKAQSNNIERFTRPPLINQMGITTDPFLGSAGAISLSSAAAQATGDPDLPTLDADPVPDPELSVADLGDLIAFSRFLAPPQRLPFDPQAREGEQLFASIGCTACHVPSLASSRGPVEAHTDLLLHDMGPGLADGLQFGNPSPGPLSNATEFRTQPLWGVSLHAPFLHDGRAKTLFEAVDLHGGEAQKSRDAFVALPVGEQRAVLSFLEHL
jgi:CxxC motif-containing protein (DUF1111 family)